LVSNVVSPWTGEILDHTHRNSFTQYLTNQGTSQY